MTVLLVATCAAILALGAAGYACAVKDERR